MSDGQSWTLKRLMTEVVGSGPRSAADMTYEQARSAFAQILADTADPTTLGAFWLANRWKSNTATELAGFIDEMHAAKPAAKQAGSPPEAAGSGQPGRPRLVDCGASYNGKKKTAILGVAAGLISAAAGVPTVVHAAGRVPTKYADSYTHVLDALGVQTDIPAHASADMVDAVGFGFYYQPRFHPKLSSLAGRRGHMGVRTFVNTVETLVNPAQAPVHLGSCYHLTFATRLIEAARASRALTFERIVFMQGLEGYDDVRPGSCKIVEDKLVEDRDGDIVDFDLQADGAGLDIDRRALEVDDIGADSARLTVEILRGDRRDHFRQAALVNAGVRIYAGGGADSVAAGVSAARQALDDGEPAERLATLRSQYGPR